jgi:cytochrome c nitrite reductase small subunit
MRPVYETWDSRPHRAVAVCDDCHPPAGIAARWRTKATSGALHAWAGASNRYEVEIRIRPASLAIAQQNGARCHADVATALHHGPRPPEDLPCARCHASVGHS